MNNQSTPEKSIIIIGAGVAGLAAGCYARMNGYRATIFELHELPGGLCTAWERRGYIFDGCIHYLFGSGESQPFYDMWMELGAIQNRPMVDHTEYQRITDGRDTLTVHTDPDLLQRHMLSLSPEDASLIRSFVGGAGRQFAIIGGFGQKCGSIDLCQDSNFLYSFCAVSVL